MSRIRSFARFLAILLLPSLCLCAEGNAPVNEASLYSKALFASVAEMEKSWGHIDDSERDTVRTDYRHMLVEADPVITEHLPSQSGEYHVEYLNDEAQIARYQKLRRGFSILKIFPLENDGPKLKIGINVYYFSYKFSHKKKRLSYGLSDWSNVEFRFDCDKQEFVISSVKLGGI